MESFTKFHGRVINANKHSVKMFFSFLHIYTFISSTFIILILIEVKGCKPISAKEEDLLPGSTLATERIS
jgi:hypothetical protein